MAPNRNYVAMEILVDELARSGVRDACLSPGNRSAPLAFALARNPRVKVWTHIDERSAGFFALGLARADGRPVVIACTSGTAAANLLPAVVEAHHSGVSLIVLTADRPPELRERSAGQTIDQLRLYGAHARWSFDLGVPEPTAAGMRHVRAAACRAVAEARGGPAGVAHLNLPMRDPLDPSEEEALPAEISELPLGVEPHTVVHAGEQRIAGEALAPVLARLEAAERPCIYAGPLDEGEPVAAAVRALADRLDAPVIAEPISNLRRGELRSRLVTGYEALLRDPDFAAAARPDLVLRVGAPPTSRTLATWLDGSGADLIVIDAAGEWPDPGCRARHILRGGTASTCRALAAGLGAPPPRGTWCGFWASATRRATGALTRALGDEGAPFEGHVIRAIAETVPPDLRVYVGNSMAVRDLDWFWPAEAVPVRILANRGANGIDGFVSSVLGAAAASEDPVLGLCGDLSFFHDISGLVAGRRLGVRACFVVSNNGGGGIFDFLSSARAPSGYAEHYEELFVTPLGLDLGPLVEGYGARFERAGRVGDIAPAIGRALRSETISVVEVPIDRGHSQAAHARAWQAVRAAGMGRT